MNAKVCREKIYSPTIKRHIDSDHYLVVARLRDRLSIIKRQRTPRRKQYNIYKPKEDENRLRFTALVENKFTETNTGKPSIDTVWQEISSVPTYAAEETLSLKEREPSNSWLYEEYRVGKDLKNEAYTTLIHRHIRGSWEEYRKWRKLENGYIARRNAIGWINSW